MYILRIFTSQPPEGGIRAFWGLSTIFLYFAVVMAISVAMVMGAALVVAVGMATAMAIVVAIAMATAVQ